MSKGSTYRPVNKKKYDENYEKIFRNKSNHNSNTKPNTK